jgi:NAD-dependent dihydropyrimidine dehydrogenase PreA subunit
VKIGEALQAAWDVVGRLLPHATRPGLRRVGNPGPDDPVLLTGNYTTTVRRLQRVLAGRDAWLLVANSKGINVWCAATGGHLTDHDVIAVIRSSGVGDEVRHRRLILPQLAATGIEPRRIERTTGWTCRWGPARLEDLPAFLDRGARVARHERFMRFPVWERLEMAAMWAVPLASIALVALGFSLGWSVAAVVATVVLLAVAAVFVLAPNLRLKGATQPIVFTLAALLATLVGAGGLWLVGRSGGLELGVLAGVCASAMAILSVDFKGSTPWYASSVNSLGPRFELELLDERCTGAAQCVLVCPRDVLKMDGRRRKVTIARPDDCVRCGACIVQCPDDALRFRFDDGRVVEPATVRRTRLNMLGRRSVEIARDDGPPT